MVILITDMDYNLPRRGISKILMWTCLNILRTGGSNYNHFDTQTLRVYMLICEYITYVFGSLVVKRCSVKAFIVSSTLTRRVIIISGTSYLVTWYLLLI